MLMMLQTKQSASLPVRINVDSKFVCILKCIPITSPKNALMSFLILFPIYVQIIALFIRSENNTDLINLTL